MRKVAVPVLMLLMVVLSFVAGRSVGANTAPEPGSEGDPLVSVSYLEQYVNQRLGQGSVGQAVILTRGDIPFDALASAPLAQKSGAIVLLTQPQTLSAEAQRTLNALKPTKIYLIGGTSAVSQQIENQVKTSFPSAQVVRLQGANRFETAEKIAAEVTGKAW